MLRQGSAGAIRPLRQVVYFVAFVVVAVVYGGDRVSARVSPGTIVPVAELGPSPVGKSVVIDGNSPDVPIKPLGEPVWRNCDHGSLRLDVILRYGIVGEEDVSIGGDQDIPVQLAFVNREGIRLEIAVGAQFLVDVGTDVLCKNSPDVVEFYTRDNVRFVGEFADAIWFDTNVGPQLAFSGILHEEYRSASGLSGDESKRQRSEQSDESQNRKESLRLGGFGLPPLHTNVGVIMVAGLVAYGAIGLVVYALTGREIQRRGFAGARLGRLWLFGWLTGMSLSLLK